VGEREMSTKKRKSQMGTEKVNEKEGLVGAILFSTSKVYVAVAGWLAGWHAHGVHRSPFFPLFAHGAVCCCLLA